MHGTQTANRPPDGRIKHFLRRCVHDREFIVMMIIPIAWYVIFCYGPMYGVQIAFRDFTPSRGISGSQWVGMKHFIEFFNSFYFWRLIRNTLLINIYSLVIGFPIPVIFAILLNETRSAKYKRFIQSATYFPYFISTVIVVGMMSTMFAVDSGVLNLTGLFGGKRVAIINNPRYFRALYIGSGIWQSFGFSAVLYIAAIAGIDQEMYEAATIDGASRFKKILYITLPCILPTITIRLLLQLGALFSQGAEKILLMYSPSTYEVADVVSTYVYRVGFTQANYSFGSAVGLFNTVLNFIVVIFFNTLARRFGETSLW